MNKKTFLLIHKYIALTVGVFIAIVCLSGASLVFRDDLAPWFTPALSIAPLAPTAGDYQRVLTAATALAPSAASVEIRVPSRRDRAVEVLLDKPYARRLYINPNTGTVVADSASQWLPFDAFLNCTGTSLPAQTASIWSRQSLCYWWSWQRLA